MLENPTQPAEDETASFKSALFITPPTEEVGVLLNFILLCENSFKPSDYHVHANPTKDKASTLFTSKSRHAQTKTDFV